MNLGALNLTALAAIPDRRDFSFSSDLGVAAWIVDDGLEWVSAAQPDTPHRIEPGGALPERTIVEHLGDGRFGLCRPTDAGAEVLLVQSDSTRSLGALATPRTCLLPRLPGADWQYLAVADFAGAAALWRIDWGAARMAEAGGLPAPVDGGVWLDDAGHRLALNLQGPSGRTSAHIVDFEARSYHRLFEVSPDSDDKIVLFDAGTGRLVVTTDAFGYPGVGLARLGDPAGVRFLPALTEGEEAGQPCAFVNGGAALLLRHEDGMVSHLRLADVETLEVGPPLPLPLGEVGSPVVSDGGRVRFPFSAPDLPWSPAAIDLADGSFRLEARPEPPPLVSARVAAFPGPEGPTPALVYPATGAGSDLAVVALHGGPIARWSAEFTAEFQLFAQLGIPVVALNYPGSTGSGQDHMRSLFGRAGSIDVEAVAAVVDALQGPEGRRVILYGESYGAFLALATAAVRPCAGVIAFAPFASFASLRQSGSDEIRELLELLDEGNPLDSGRNLLKAQRTYPGKVLIAHGTADRTIPAAESRELARAWRERDGAGEDEVQLVELHGHGHRLAGRDVLEHWFREVAAFVATVQGVEIACPTRSQQQGRCAGGLENTNPGRR